MRFVNRFLSVFRPAVKGTHEYKPPQLALPLRRDPRILILKLDRIGDVLLGMRAFQEIRNAWPGARISLVCSPTNAPLAKGLGIFDRVIEYRFFADSSHIDRPDDAILAARFSALGLPKFDIAIDLRYDPDTRFFLDLVDAKYICGFFANRLKRPLDIALPRLEFPPRQNPRQLRSPDAEARLLLLARTVVDAFRQASHPIHRLKSNGSARLLPKRPFAILSPATSAAIKQWPNAHLAEVGRALVRKGLSVVLVGDKTMQLECAEIAAMIASKKVHDLSGILPIEELPGVLKRARLFIGNDSAPGHMAALLNVPTVVVFSGAYNIDIWHPRGPHAVAIKADISCSPCYIAKPEDCSNKRRCLTAISPDSVVAAALKLCRKKQGSKRVPRPKP